MDGGGGEWGRVSMIDESALTGFELEFGLLGLGALEAEVEAEVEVEVEVEFTEADFDVDVVEVDVDVIAGEELILVPVRLGTTTGPAGAAGALPDLKFCAFFA